MSRCACLVDGCASGASAAKPRKGKGLKAEAGDSDGGGESCCTPEDTHADVLGDAGMILRDPPVLHLLLHETVRVRAVAVYERRQKKHIPRVWMPSAIFLC